MANGEKEGEGRGEMKTILNNFQKILTPEHRLEKIYIVHWIIFQIYTFQNILELAISFFSNKNKIPDQYHSSKMNPSVITHKFFNIHHNLITKPSIK